MTDDLTNSIVTIWDDYVEFEDSKVAGSKGQKKKKKKPTSIKKQKQVLKQITQNAWDTRNEMLLERLQKVWIAFPKFKSEETKLKWVDTYINWLQISLRKKEAYIDESDFDSKFIKSNKHAGGQNVNKVNSAVFLKHMPTNIFVKVTQTRDQFKNREIAQDLIYKLIQEHFLDLQLYLKTHTTKELSDSLFK